MKIWFIWQGFIGWNMAKDFEERGYEVRRYSKNTHKEDISECEFIFVAVPTPTVNRKFDSSVLFEAIKNTYSWQKIIIKSTIQPWTTDKLQELYPDRYFFHSGEFLAERTAFEDVKNPSRNVVWYTKNSFAYREEVMALLPKSKEVYCTAMESELWKYMSNFLLTLKVIGANIIYDICKRDNMNYDKVKEIASLDPRIWKSHLEVEFEGGRGANWHCFPKDLSALAEYYDGIDIAWEVFLDSMEAYNIDLNFKSWKQLDIIKKVYWLK